MARVAIFLSQVINFYELLIVVWAILSWIPMRAEGILSDIAQAIDRLVRPYVGLFRRFIPPMGGIDFSPLVAMLALQLVGNAVLRILIG